MEFGKAGKYAAFGFIVVVWALMFIFGYEHRQYVESQERQAKEFKLLFENSETKIQTLENDLKACRKSQAPQQTK